MTRMQDDFNRDSQPASERTMVHGLAAIPQPSPVVINLTINNGGSPRKDEEPDLEHAVCDEVFGFALAMQSQIKGTSEDWLKFPLESYLRKIEEGVSQLRAAIDLKLDIKTVVVEAAKVANDLMMGTEVYIEEHSGEDS